MASGAKTLNDRFSFHIRTYKAQFPWDTLPNFATVKKAWSYCCLVCLAWKISNVLLQNKNCGERYRKIIRAYHNRIWVHQCARQSQRCFVSILQCYCSSPLWNTTIFRYQSGKCHAFTTGWGDEQRAAARELELLKKVQPLKRIARSTAKRIARRTLGDVNFNGNNMTMSIE